MTTEMLLTLPWPPSQLNPNQRVHWAALAKAKGRFRFACAMTAREQGATRLQAASLGIHMLFVPPDRRRRDLDNMIAAMKPGLDGLADVLGVDDSRWKLAAEKVEGDQIGGFVRVTVQILEEDMRLQRAVSAGPFQLAGSERSS